MTHQKILIVDPSAANRQWYAHALGTVPGTKVVSVDSLADALAQARDPPSAMLLAPVALIQQALREQATLDPVTRLPNRALFQDRLGLALARAARNRQLLALAHIEVEVARSGTQAQSAAAADALAVAVAERLIRSLRATDTVAHLGGGRFAVLLEGPESAADAEHAIGKLHAQLNGPVALPTPGGEVIPTPVCASIGLSLYPEHARDANDLATLAAITLLAAKGTGRGVLLYPGAVMAPWPRHPAN
jgi:diguanylate cyclase (GGDEF)-like protein